MAQPSPVISTARKTKKAPAAVFPAQCFSCCESTGLWWKQIKSGERSANEIISNATQTRTIPCKGSGALTPHPKGRIFFTLPLILPYISFHNLLLASVESGKIRRCLVLAHETSSAGDCPRAPKPVAPTAEPASAPRHHPQLAQAAPTLPLPLAPFPQQRVRDQGTTPGFPSPASGIYLLCSKPPRCSEQTPTLLDRMRTPSFSTMETEPRAARVGASPRSPCQRLPPPRNIQQAAPRVMRSSPASQRQGLGWLRDAGGHRHRLSSWERCHGCSISPGCSVAWRPRSQCPTLAAQRADKHDRQENGFPVAFQSLL